MGADPKIGRGAGQDRRPLLARPARLAGHPARSARFELDSPLALENLNRLAARRQDRAPHGDTLNYFLGRLAPGEIEGLRLDMVRRLLRMKVLEGARLFGHFPVVVDGTGPWAIKNFYLLMQLAHLIVQLIERGNLLVGRCETLFGSLRAMARRLAESIRNHLIDANALDIAAAARIQIRLSPS